MPGFVLGEQAIRQIRELLRVEASRLQNPDTQRARWQGHQPACDHLAFEIVTADCSEKTATGKILYRQCGCGTVPGEYDVGGVPTVDLIDPTCFMIQSTDDNLIGRQGFSHYMHADAAEVQNEIQTLDITGTAPTSGTFKITVTIDGTTETTGTIDWDASAADVKAALEALTIIDEVTCGGGDLPGTAITIEFTGPLVKEKNITLMTCGTQTLDNGTAVITDTQTGSTGGCQWVIVWLCPINETCA